MSAGAGPGPGRPVEDAVRGELIDAARSLGRLGLVPGRAGDVSVRWHRGGGDGLLLTPEALAWERCTADDLSWIPIEAPAAADGAPADPRADGTRAPSAGWRLHRELYARRDDVGAVVRVLAPFAAALSCLPAVQRDGIPAFHDRIAAVGGSDVRCAPYAAPGSPGASAAALGALDGRRACLLAHHGLLAVGPTLASAIDTAIELEWLARGYAITLGLGGPAMLPADAPPYGPAGPSA